MRNSELVARPSECPVFSFQYCVPTHPDSSSARCACLARNDMEARSPADQRAHPTLVVPGKPRHRRPEEGGSSSSREARFLVVPRGACDLHPEGRLDVSSRARAGTARRGIWGAAAKALLTAIVCTQDARTTIARYSPEMPPPLWCGRLGRTSIATTPAKMKAIGPELEECADSGIVASD